MTDPRLDELPADRVIDLLLAAEARVLPAVRRAAPELAKAVELVAAVVADGGRLVFAGAGTSGRLAAAEAAELPGTFGVTADRCVALIAEDGSALVNTDAEDDDAAGRTAVAAAGIGPGDVLIAVAASGRTPYSLAAAAAARAAGTPVVAVVTAAGTPLAEVASVAIEAVIGDEVLRGSTRLTAGTAQKVVLNTLTTAAMARAGRVHGNLMIDVVAANAKLRERAAGIVASVAGCSTAAARAALEACGQDARAAVVHLVLGLPPDAARRRGAQHPSLRAALELPRLDSNR